MANVQIPEMQAVKSKFPLYKDVPDDTLLKAAATKFPEQFGKIADKYNVFEKQPLATAMAGPAGVVEQLGLTGKYGESKPAQAVRSEFAKQGPVQAAALLSKTLQSYKGGLRATLSDWYDRGGLATLKGEVRQPDGSIKFVQPSGDAFTKGVIAPDKQKLFGQIFTDFIDMKPTDKNFVPTAAIADSIINVGLDIALFKGIGKGARAVGKFEKGWAYKQLSSEMESVGRRAGLTPEQSQAWTSQYVEGQLAKTQRNAISTVKVIKESTKFVKDNRDALVGFMKRSVQADAAPTATKIGVWKDMVRKEVAKPTLLEQQSFIGQEGGISAPTKVAPAPPTGDVASSIVEQAPKLTKEPAVSFSALEKNPTLADYVLKRPKMHDQAVRAMAAEIKGIDPELTNVTTNKPIETMANPNDPATNKVLERITRRQNIKKAKHLKLDPNGKPIVTFNPMLDTTHAMQEAEMRTGVPFYSEVYVPLSKSSNVAKFETATDINKITAGIDPENITKEVEQALAKYIEEGEGKLSPNLLELAEKIKAGTKKYIPKIKYVRMRKMIDGVVDTPKIWVDLVEKGRTVLDVKGADALKEWVKDKNFGVIEAKGYLPRSIRKGTVLGERSSDLTNIKNPHVEARTLEQDLDTRTLLKRVHSYFMKMNMDYYMYDDLKHLKMLAETVNLSGGDYRGLSMWIRSLTGRGIETGAFGHVARSARGQFFNVSLADPRKFVRNRLQNIAFLYGKYPLGATIGKRLTAKWALTPEEQDYFNKHISQLGELQNEHFALSAIPGKRIPIFGQLNKLSRKVANYYTKTDSKNRDVATRFIIAGLEKDIASYKSGKMSFAKLSKNHLLNTLNDLELKYVLSLPPKQAALEIGRLVTEMAHGRYKQHEKGFAALSELGEFASSLYTFPKITVNLVGNALRMITQGNTFAQRANGFRIMAGTLAGSAIASAMYDKLVGTVKYFDKRTRKEKKSDPYNIWDILFGITIGGAQGGQLEGISNIYQSLGELAYNTTIGRGQASEKENMAITRSALKSMDSLGEQFLPFVRKGLDVVEGMMGYKYYKILTTSFDKLTERTSALKNIEIERNWIERVSHAVFGTERYDKD